MNSGNQFGAVIQPELYAWFSVNFGRQYTPWFSVRAGSDLFYAAGAGVAAGFDPNSFQFGIRHAF
ncbi:MAG: hypothetical protein IH604_00840 [Burkholderiales bacterium]|nr:hypothetical protein [Burkholderiales bacterium]